MARRRRRRKNTGDQIIVSLILVAPRVGVRARRRLGSAGPACSRLGWPPTRLERATLPDSEAALRRHRSFLRRFLRYTGLQPQDFGEAWADVDHNGLRHTQ